MLGLGSTDLPTDGINLSNPDTVIYYDNTGSAVCNGLAEPYYPADTTGILIHLYGSYYGQDFAGWQNSTGQYYLYYDNSGSNAKWVLYKDFGKIYQQTAASSSFDISSSIGLIGLVVGLMALAAVVGIRVLGTGVSEESVSAILKGTALLAIWGIFSVLALALLIQIPMLGPVFYFVLTIIYTLGIINQIGHPGDD